MILQHLVSTMFRNDCTFLDEMNICNNVLIVNQGNHIDEKTHEQDNYVVRMLSTKERGLSNSRNMLLDNMDGDIAILGDDDIEYINGYEKIILDAYKTYPDADIITFRFSESKEYETHKRFLKPKKLNIFNISKVASVEITFKIDSIKEKGIRFCPVLGVGTELGSSEENAFLSDALRAGLKICHIPQTICYLQPTPPERQKWKDGFNKDYFVKKGGCFFRVYGKILFLPMCCAFVLLKKRNLFKNVNVFKAIVWMLSGKSLFKKAESEQCS